MLVENRGETVGTLAGSVLYPKTWLVHQLGVAERDRAGAGMFLDLAHELYAGLMYMFQHQASANYFVIFAERDKRWTHTLYGDFVAQYPDRSALAYTENRVFRRSVTAPGSRRVNRNKSVRVVPADAGHLALISRRLEASCSPVEYDSLAYSISEITLERFSETCRARGSERERRLWVALEAGLPKAALIAENGGEGVNIFGLLNRCSIVPLGPEAVALDTIAVLLDQATEHFAGLGKEEFLFFDEHGGSAEELSLLGLELISDGMRFIASKQVVPAWLSYLKGVLSLRATAAGGSRA
jgi:hypothetical protein